MEIVIFFSHFIAAFVNNNIPKEKALTIKKLVGIINKRAPEWRKANHSKQTRKKMLSSTEPGVRDPYVP